MALVRAASPGSTPKRAPVEAYEVLLQLLSDPDAGERRRAARSLATCPEAASTLAACLQLEKDAGVREALFSGLIDIGGTAVGVLMAPLLRSADASLRGGAVEALKRLGAEAVPAVDACLGDPDDDLRLLAIEVTRAWPVGLAMPRLRRVLENDPHVNVCGAAVDVATEAGDAALLPALAALKVRFADQPFLLFAATVASSRIHAAGADGE